ncbi:MAG: hypothetical protein IBJ15_08680 [Alphaproteobacteria bacterium]|nr:hypothetical protein [Alphaproteobacteria bacterium]
MRSVNRAAFRLARLAVLAEPNQPEFVVGLRHSEVRFKLDAEMLAELAQGNLELAIDATSAGLYTAVTMARQASKMAGETVAGTRIVLFDGRRDPSPSSDQHVATLAGSLGTSFLTRDDVAQGALGAWLEAGLPKEKPASITRLRAVEKAISAAA